MTAGDEIEPADFPANHGNWKHVALNFVGKLAEECLSLNHVLNLPLVFFEDDCARRRMQDVKQDVTDFGRDAEAASTVVNCLLGKSGAPGFWDLEPQTLTSLLLMFVYTAFDVAQAPFLLGEFAATRKLRLMKILSANTLAAMRVWTAYLIAYPSTFTKEVRWWQSEEYGALGNLHRVYMLTKAELQEEEVQKSVEKVEEALRRKAAFAARAIKKKIKLDDTDSGSTDKANEDDMTLEDII